ncbi:MAG: phosphatase PAP2 family protein [Chitinophagaceae bacterium]|nr:phosphatase PAP2 family protein [Chitinophagaceae bacterium]
MKKIITILIAVLMTAAYVQAQSEPAAGKWKTWFITSGKDYRLPAPPSYKEEMTLVLSRQQSLDSAGRQQILYWNAGAPGYRWQEMMNKLWMTDTGYNGALANMLLGVATYDATIAAWDTKYAYKRPRPFAADNRIKAYVLKPESPSYPCEYSIAAGVAVTIISHFFPSLADSVNRMAQQVMASRIAAGTAFPSDTRAGFEMGKRIAEKEIEHTKDFVPKTAWDGKMPEGPGRWKGKKPMFPLAGLSKTVVLDSSSQFRPGPPPDFTKDMAELKNFKQTFRSQANAFYWASQDFWNEALNKKIFEYNLHLNPPRAARLYAITAVGYYDAFVACWDAKYAYWGTRPDQYDTTYHSLMPTPPFPGYPSGHAAISGVMGELYSYFFPAERAYFQKKAKEAAESRFQAGIHFRTDNDVALELGRKVAAAIIQKAKTDGADDNLVLANRKNTDTKAPMR